MTEPDCDVHPLVVDTDPIEPVYQAAVTKISLHGPAVLVGLGADASDPDQVTDYVHRLSPHGAEAIVLDLTDMAFLWLQGLRATLGLGEWCGKATVAWAVVTGQSILRLLRALESGDLLRTVGPMA